MKKIMKYILTASFAFLFCLLFAGGVGMKAEAKERAAGDMEIESEAELWAFVNMSKGHDFQGNIITLTKDITLTYDGHEGENLTIGTEDKTFKGTFDGQNHTITGLEYIENDAKPLADTGLFGVTDGATIKNLIVKDAEVQSDMRGGIVVGYAKNTDIMNVRVEGGGLSVAAADNVLLIGTDLGIRGGGIVGEANNSLIYNCEVKNCFIRSNNTSAVAALAGKPMTLGGIVGCAEASTVEYCRVTGTDPYGDDDSQKTRIRIHYDVAVGAIGGNTLYVGGIAGRIWSGDDDDNDGIGTQIIDSFSTATMHYYCATYVSVLGVNVGHIGGITAEIWDNGCSIKRCHFAGRETSEQWNPILVIPIIQKNVNLDGIADIVRGDNTAANITSTRFKPSVNNGIDMDALGGSATGEAGPWADSLYENRDVWEDTGYDFTGEINRQNNKYNEEHSNKWVMDYNLGIPVHGNSFAADFDFPGAGEVSIDKTSLISAPVSTDDPYNFAVQGFDTFNNQIDVTAKLKDVEGHGDAYKLEGWYLKRDGEKDRGTISNIRSYYSGIVKDENKVADGTNSVYTADTENTADNKKLENLDLYVAHVQAQVVFHDVSGEKVLDKDYYNYQDNLPDVKPADLEGCKFYGWTDILDDSDSTPGYEGITSGKLDELRKGGNLYEAGDKVEKPLKLYPVYTNYISNIQTVIEGYDSGDYDKRTGVGTTSVQMIDGEVHIVAAPEGGINWGEGKGYVFKGWYEIDVNEAEPNFPKDDEGKDYPGILVSTDETFSLAGVDLSQEHRYIARFEYEVEYWVSADLRNGDKYDKDNGNNPAGDRYVILTYTYGQGFKSIEGPSLYNQSVTDWHTDECEIGGSLIDNCGGQKIEDGTKIKDPCRVYSHIVGYGSGDVHPSVSLETDFPGAVKIEGDFGIADTNVKVTAVPQNISGEHNDYQFVFWSWESTVGTVHNIVPNTYLDKNMHESIAGRFYQGLARAVANVRFHDVNNACSTVTRIYKEGVLLDAAVDHLANGDYNYKFTNSSVIDELNSYSDSIAVENAKKLSVSAVTPEAVGREGYYFAGWIDGTTLSDYEIAYIYGDSFANGTYEVSDLRKAAPYITELKEKVTRTAMDIYPVYVKADITRTTNIAEKGQTSFSGYELNIPDDPMFQLSDGNTTNVTLEGITISDEKGTASFTLGVEDNKTSVYKKDGQNSEEKYRFDHLECIYPDGTVETLTPDDGNGLMFTVNDVILGQPYKFIAYYEPLMVVYHVDQRETSVEFRNTGKALGASPNPKFTAETIGSTSAFVGWTTEEPADGKMYYMLGNYDDKDTIYIADPSNRVTDMMELYPVYAPTKITVQSNIDSELNEEKQSDLRYVTTDLESGTATIHAGESITLNGEKYVFTGWKKVEGEIKIDFSEDLTASVDNIFEPAVYEAQYGTGYTINYHYIDAAGKDEILYTATVAKDSERTKEAAENAEYFGFVYLMDDPSAGEDEGKPGKVEVPYDIDAFSAINEKLTESQHFEQWQWKNNEGKLVDWSEFCKEPIKGDMDLYPVIWNIGVTRTDDTDSSKEIDLLQDGTVIVQADFEPKDDAGNPAGDEAVVNINFAGVYTWSNLKVTVTKQQGESKEFTGVEKIPVNVYSEYTLKPPAEGETEPTESKKLLADGQTDDRGIAEFIFDGTLVLTKTMAQGSEGADGEPYIFTITQMGENGTPGQSTKVIVPAGESVKVKLPFGEYTVDEDAGWAWRYSASLEADTHAPDTTTINGDTSQQNTGVDAGDMSGGTKVYINSYESTVTCTNTESNSKWFDSSSNVKNVFGKAQAGQDDQNNN